MANGKSSKGQRGREAPPSVEEESSQDKPFGHLGGLQLLAMRRRMRPREIVPLPDKVRAPMERSFGENFADVKMHLDSPRAGGSTHALTEGNHIHFAPDRFQPDTVEGKQLIGHELAHVVQQRGRAPMSQAFSPKDQRSLLEQDADQAGAHAAAGLPAAVRFAATPLVAQRFDSYEHVQIGNAANRPITLNCGIVLTYGEMVALSGDFYHSWEGVMHAPPGEINNLLRLIRRQQAQADANHGRPTAKQTAQNDAEFEQATAGREQTHHNLLGPNRPEGDSNLESHSYLSEAKHNDGHFSLDNINKWELAHRDALQLIRDAFKQSGNKPISQNIINEAYARDAFGSHFLTDAFSAGHLFSGVFGREIGAKYWNAHRFEIIQALARAAHNDGHAFDISTATSLVEAVIMECDGASLCLMVVHNYLNEIGLWVKNRRGNEWKILGDQNLSNSPETMQFASESVKLSVQEIDVAATGRRHQGMFSPLDLVPNEVSFDNKKTYESIDQFSIDEVQFLSYLGDLTFLPTKDNAIYKLIKDNLGLAKVKGETFLADKKHDLSEIHRIIADPNPKIRLQ